VHSSALPNELPVVLSQFDYFTHLIPNIKQISHESNNVSNLTCTSLPPSQHLQATTRRRACTTRTCKNNEYNTDKQLVHNEYNTDKQLVHNEYNTDKQLVHNETTIKV
jgi:hypothetical protein